MKYLLNHLHPDFPNQLTQIRLSLNTTCVEFAKICGVSRSCIRRYEDKTLIDAANPRMANWTKIKEGLDKIKYFEDKPIPVEEPKAVMVPYQTFWQPVKPHQKLNHLKIKNEKIN